MLFLNTYSDLAEFTLAFAYSYDWMYDAWSADQRNAIMWSIINLGLDYGMNSYRNQSSGYSWWQSTNGKKGKRIKKAESALANTAFLFTVGITFVTVASP